MKIAFIPQNNPYNRNSWSGTDYYVRECLEKLGNDVYCIYGFKYKETFLDKFYKISAKLRGKRYLVDRTKRCIHKWAYYINERLQPNTDVIFSLGTLQVADLNTEIPIYIYVDGVFEQMRIDYKWGDITQSGIKVANEIEQKAIDKCKKILSASTETKMCIKQYYKCPPEKIEVVPLGANFDKYPTEDEIEKIISMRCSNNSVCNLLFVGVDWYRKGADIVLNVLKILNKCKFPTMLYLVGIKDIPEKLPENVINYGFINKNTENGMNKLKELYSQSHFLFVPSRAEAFGLVFCEASAYSLPSISHHVGGIYTIIENGINGQLFPINSNPKVIANYIINTFKDKEKYKKLCRSSYKRFADYLNWNVTGKKIERIIKTTC